MNARSVAAVPVMKVEDGEFAYVDGELPLAMTDEEHAEGYALACQARASRSGHQRGQRI